MRIDTTGAGDRWIPDDEYALITRRVPIACVDLLPLADRADLRIGLIFRETVDGEKGWCLVGGSVLINEPVGLAIRRHLAVTLGSSVNLLPETLRLVTVIEYFPQAGVGEFHDPRKHAIALTHAAGITGTPKPGGEALDFQWFTPDRLPAEREFGFGQGRVVQRLLSDILDATSR